VVKRLTTTRSVNLEMKERLEMGRYELHVSGSIVNFLSRGRTCACLSMGGKMPDCMDRLHRWQISGAIHVDRADRRFNSHVGIGSRGHDFDGLVCSRVRISRSDTGENEDSGGTRLLAMTGGGAAAVDSRMLLTLFLKKLRKVD